MLPADVANGQCFLISLATRTRWGQWLEVEGVSSSELCREDGGREGCVEVVFCRHGHCLVSPFALGHDNIQDVVFETVET